MFKDFKENIVLLQNSLGISVKKLKLYKNKQHNTNKGTNIQMMTNFSSKTITFRRQIKGNFKVLKEQIINIGFCVN